MASKKHPENLKEVNALKVTPELTTFVNELAQNVETERTNRSTWEININKGINLRYGIRNVKVSPWKNCANFSVPLVDTHINTNKAAYVNLINANPICTFEPYGPEDVEPSRKRELLFDWRMKTKVRFFEPYNYGVDIALEQGVVIWKVIWKFTTNTYTEFVDLKDFDEQTLGALFDKRVNDQMLMQIIEEEYGVDMTYQENYDAVMGAVKKFREGATEFSMKLVETEDNQPEVIPLSLLEDVVVPIETTDIQQALFIDHKIWRTINDVKIDMNNEKYEKFSDDEIKAWGGGIKASARRNKRISVVDDKMVLIHETCCWYDVNDDGIEERCIVTYPDADPDAILRFIEVPYDHGLFPYSMTKRELNDRCAYSSRGYPLLDEDYQVAISKALNQAIDVADVSLPRLVHKKGALGNVKNIRYSPMENIEVQTGTVDDVRFEYPTNMNQGFIFQQIQMLKAWADNRIGNVQAALSDPTNLAGSGQGGKKSAREAGLIANMASGVQSLDLLVWQMQMADVYFQIDALYDQFGDESEEVAITGEQPLKVNRREIQGRFHIIPNGRLENTDPMLRAQKTFNLLRIFAGDEDIKQSELKKLYLMDYDPRIAKKIMLTQEEMQQRDGMKKQIQSSTKQQMQGDAISMKHISNLLDVNKEQMLSKIPRREIVIDYNDTNDGNPLRQNAPVGSGKSSGSKSTRQHTAKITYGG